MSQKQIKLSQALLWGAITALLYWGLFHYASTFLHLAHTTQDACTVSSQAKIMYFTHASPELCGTQHGSFIKGHWWNVLAPIALAFALSFTHGNFTSVFWDVIGLKAKSHAK